MNTQQTNSTMFPLHSDVVFNILINDMQQRLLAEAMRKYCDDMQYSDAQTQYEAKALREMLCGKLAPSPNVNAFVL